MQIDLETIKSALNEYAETGKDLQLRKLMQATPDNFPEHEGAGYLIPIELVKLILAELKSASIFRQLVKPAPVVALPIKDDQQARAGSHVALVALLPASDWPVKHKPIAALGGLATTLSTIIVDAIQEWSEQENQLFLYGDKRGHLIKGILEYETNEGELSWGKLTKHVALGDPRDTRIFTPTLNELESLMYSLPAAYRGESCHWMMSAHTCNAISNITDGNGDSIVTRRKEDMLQKRLFNFPIVLNEQMPPLRRGECPIIFGNFARAYRIYDANLSIVRDPYSAKPYVLFYVEKITTGKVIDFDALKLLQIR